MLSRGPVAAPAQDAREKVLQGLQQQEQELHNLLAEGEYSGFGY